MTPDPGQRSRLQRIIDHVSQSMAISPKEISRAGELEEAGFIGFDAVHLACAESGEADVFLTTDDRLLKLAKRKGKQLQVKVENPLDWLKEIL